MENFLILLPFVAFLLLFLILKNDFSLRVSFIWASVIIAVWIFLTTEFLSLFDLLIFEGVLGAWLLALIALISYIFLKKNPIFFSLVRLKFSFPIFYAIILGLFLLLLLSIAILQAPNNWDSMTYHLPKILHWIAHKNVNHYATHIGRQIALNPMAEYLILHTFLLTANDYFANAVQWFSMVGLVVLASLIAESLGASWRGQVVASFLTISIPIAILEATSTQNDLVVTYFILITIWAFLKLREEKKYHWAFLVGLAMGLALLTKSTAYFYLAPWVLLFAGTYLRFFSLSVLKQVIYINGLIAT